VGSLAPLGTVATSAFEDLAASFAHCPRPPLRRASTWLFEREENSARRLLIVHVAESRQGGIATSPRFTPPPLTCMMILRRSSLASEGQKLDRFHFAFTAKAIRA